MKRLCRGNVVSNLQLQLQLQAAELFRLGSGTASGIDIRERESIFSVQVDMLSTPDALQLRLRCCF
jgi:hypothetical protein